MSKLHHADRIIDVSILPDFSVDTVANNVWVSYIEGSRLRPVRTARRIDSSRAQPREAGLRNGNA